MKAGQRYFGVREILFLAAMLTLCTFAVAQQGDKEPAKTDVSGRYEGSAKGENGDVIDVTFDLTEKDGAISGVIHSSHGDFNITSGSHKGDTVTLEFATDGPTGTITLRRNEDRLAGTWSAGDDGGPVDVKKVAAQADKGKS